MIHIGKYNANFRPATQDHIEFGRVFAYRCICKYFVYLSDIAEFRMKITLLTVGKTDKKWVKEGLDIYSSRLRHYIPFSITEIPELKNVSSLTKEQIKSREGELILKNIRPDDDLILMDEHGKEHSSTEFAKVLQDKISYIGKDIVFVIGGAYGFSEAVYKRADSKISLSRMTFSHQMVRAIFVEQLYRAFTIMRGEPYHHE